MVKTEHTRWTFGWFIQKSKLLYCLGCSNADLRVQKLYFNVEEFINVSNNTKCAAAEKLKQRRGLFFLYYWTMIFFWKHRHTTYVLVFQFVRLVLDHKKGGSLEFKISIWTNTRKWQRTYPKIGSLIHTVLVRFCIPVSLIVPKTEHRKNTSHNF